MWGLTIPPKGQRAHYPMYDSDTIHNSPSPPLVDIVCFAPLHIVISLTGGRGFHTLTRNVSFPSPTDVRSHNSIPFEAQHPSWHTAQCMTHTIRNSPNPPLVDIVRFGPFHIVVNLTVGRGFQALTRNVSFPSPIDVRSHNSTSLGASVLAITLSNV